MRYIHIKNWERYQHYDPDKRKPPWLKLYRDLLTDYEFMQLPEGDRWAIVGLMLLALECNNSIVTDPKWIRVRLNLKHSFDYESPRYQHFITIDDSVMLPLRREEKRREENPLPPTPKKPPKKKRAGAVFMSPPSVGEVQAYLDKKGESRFTAQQFVDANQARGWVDKNGNRYIDWKAVVRLWISFRNIRDKGGNGGGGHTADPYAGMRREK